MSKGIDLELPVWSATIIHNTPKSDGLWFRAFNSPLDDEAAALKKAIELYAEEGLSKVHIYRIEIAPLIQFGEEGRNAGS